MAATGHCLFDTAIGACGIAWTTQAIAAVQLPESTRAGTRERLASRMNAAVAAELDRLGDRLNILATVGSVAPFVGLFGTVWGIMRSFTAIAGANNTSLAVVAGPIAEALFATAIGLVAAIPAVIAYNKLSSDAGKMIGGLEGFADEFSTILSRQLEARGR